MLAAFITELGDPQVVQIGNLPVPQSGPTDVLVAVEAVAADPVDAFIRSGRYRTPTPFPFIVGRDLVGTVAAAGEGSMFTVGERVWCNSLGHDGRQGSFAEFAVVPHNRCYRLPPGPDPDHVVAVAHPAATAYLGWFVHARLRLGETVYVGGAAGNVGTAATTMARRAGATVVAGARLEHHDRCREAGADIVLDYREQDFAKRLRATAPAGIDVFWDTSGHHDFDLVADVMVAGGRVLLTAAATARPELPVPRLYTRDVSLHGFVISRATVDDLAAAAHLINDMLADGSLAPRITAVLPLTETAQVHAQLEAGQVDGRIVLRPWRYISQGPCSPMDAGTWRGSSGGPR